MNKQVCPTTVSPLGDRKMAFTISTAAVDREGDRIDPNGWDLSNFQRSPVVLWAHDHTQPPIGKASNLWTDAKGLHATVEFPPRGLYAFADMIHDMVKSGFINATSVGFVPRESQRNHTGGQDITRAELLEFSLVSVPANPHALVLQRSVNTSAMMKWLGQTEGDIDLDGLFPSGNEPEIQWSSIHAQWSTRPDVDVTTNDVERVMVALAPAFREGIRAGFKAHVQEAVHATMCRLTGRLD